MRLVDIHSTRYAIARRYMIRLRRDDFEDPHELAKFAATAGCRSRSSAREFEYLVAGRAAAAGAGEAAVNPDVSTIDESVPAASGEPVIPAHAGIQAEQANGGTGVDARFRGHDELRESLRRTTNEVGETWPRSRGACTGKAGGDLFCGVLFIEVKNGWRGYALITRPALALAS